MRNEPLSPEGPDLAVRCSAGDHLSTYCTALSPQGELEWLMCALDRLGEGQAVAVSRCERTAEQKVAEATAAKCLQVCVWCNKGLRSLGPAGCRMAGRGLHAGALWNACLSGCFCPLLMMRAVRGWCGRRVASFEPQA
jgi:hypothetical protein